MNLRVILFSVINFLQITLQHKVLYIANYLMLIEDVGHFETKNKETEPKVLRITSRDGAVCVYWYGVIGDLGLS